MEAIRVKNLCKVYGTKDAKIMALDHINMEIGEGEFVAVMGASGSGKSTLLHLLGGLDRADSGSVEYFGENLLDMNDVQLSDFRLHNIGFIFQAYNLFPELSVYENILLPFRMDHRKGGKKEAQELMELLGLMDRRNHLPQQLSGGQQQRVAIARAMVMKPRVLLCDEPTGNLDRSSGKAVMGLLQRLHKEYGMTIVMVTHDEVLAGKTERILRMCDGRFEK